MISFSSWSRWEKLADHAFSLFHTNSKTNLFSHEILRNKCSQLKAPTASQYFSSMKRKATALTSNSGKQHLFQNLIYTHFRSIYGSLKNKNISLVLVHSGITVDANKNDQTYTWYLMWCRATCLPCNSIVCEVLLTLTYNVYYQEIHIFDSIKF